MIIKYHYDLDSSYVERRNLGTLTFVGDSKNDGFLVTLSGEKLDEYTTTDLKNVKSRLIIHIVRPDKTTISSIDTGDTGLFMLDDIGVVSTKILIPKQALELEGLISISGTLIKGDEYRTIFYFVGECVKAYSDTVGTSTGIMDVNGLLDKLMQINLTNMMAQSTHLVVDSKGIMKHQQNPTLKSIAEQLVSIHNEIKRIYYKDPETGVQTGIFVDKSKELDKKFDDFKKEYGEDSQLHIITLGASDYQTVETVDSTTQMNKIVKPTLVTVKYQDIHSSSGPFTNVMIIPIKPGYNFVLDPIPYGIKLKLLNTESKNKMWTYSVDFFIEASTDSRFVFYPDECYTKDIHWHDSSGNRCPAGFLTSQNPDTLDIWRHHYQFVNGTMILEKIEKIKNVKKLLADMRAKLP